MALIRRAAAVDTESPASGVRMINRRRVSAAYTTFAALCAVCFAALWLYDRDSAVLSLPTACYGAVLAGLTKWLIPRRAAPADLTDDVLRSAGSARSLAARNAVVAASFAWVVVIGIAIGGLYGGVYVPVLSPWMRFVRAAHTGFRDGAQPYHALAIEILIPGALMLAFGATRRQLGVTRPVAGTARALLACLALPLVMSAVALTSGGISFAALVVATLRSTMSGGFSEEFLTRGVWLAQLRRYLSDDWALVFSAVLFAIPHIGGTLAEEHGSVALSLANNIALNAPIGLALGFMALRSRSLLLPGAVHTSLDVMLRLTGTH